MGPLLSAVLFDMDGTLVETEQHWGEAHVRPRGRAGRGSCGAGRGSGRSAPSMRFAMRMLYEDLGVARSEDELLADARWVEDRTAS